MKKRIEVRSQAEFDLCIKAGNIAIVIGCSVVAWGNSSVEARENSSVVAWGNSSVEAWGNSSVVARENSSVEAWGNSSVVAWGNVFVRLFSALSIKASAHVAIMVHGEARTLTGGNQVKAMPPPKIGSECCEYFGIDRATSPLVVPNIDAAMLASIERNAAANKNGLKMSGWHGADCDETNWCETTHCRAGYAICLVGKAGFDLERKVGSEVAGQMIYAASRPDMPLPDFHASDKDAMDDIRACAAEQAEVVS
jgi:hypothetical protein